MKKNVAFEDGILVSKAPGSSCYICGGKEGDLFAYNINFILFQRSIVFKFSYKDIQSGFTHEYKYIPKE